MAPLIYFLALLVSLLGIGAGVMLAFLAKEELEGIRRYLVLAKKLALGGLMGIVGLIYSGSTGVCILFCVLGFGLGWFIHEENMIHLILGGIFFVGSLSDGLFPLAACLILLHGFASGTLLAHSYMAVGKRGRSGSGNNAELARKAAGIGGVYFISAGILYLLKYFLS